MHMYMYMRVHVHAHVHAAVHATHCVCTYTYNDVHTLFLQHIVCLLSEEVVQLQGPPLCSSVYILPTVSITSPYGGEACKHRVEL